MSRSGLRDPEGSCEGLADSIGKAFSHTNASVPMSFRGQKEHRIAFPWFVERVVSWRDRRILE